MKNISWGNPTWTFLHTFVSKINKNNFNENKHDMIDIIISICSNLPCPECSNHAIEFLNTVYFKNVTKKEDLIEILYVFHNQVNKNLRKPEFSEEKLEIYNSKDMKEILDTFLKAYNMRPPSALMNLSFRRNSVTKKIKDFFSKNIELFK